MLEVQLDTRAGFYDFYRDLALEVLENAAGWPEAGAARRPRAQRFDPEDFDPAWRSTIMQLAASDGVTVEAGNEVMHEGCVVDLDLATVRRGDRTVRLVDDARASADEVANALATQGQRVVRALATETAVAARVLAALEREE